MKYFEKKIAKMVEEFIVLARKVDAKDINIHVNEDAENIFIKCDFDFDYQYIKKIERLEQRLNPIDKNEGFGGMYWELVGESSPELNVQLSLIGQMIDHADVDIQGNVVHLLLTKSKNV